jgi:hypothetical protein
VREIDACRTNEVIYENERISGRKSFPELNGRKTVQCRFNCEAAFFMRIYAIIKKYKDFPPAPAVTCREDQRRYFEGFSAGQYGRCPETGMG